MNGHILSEFIRNEFHKIYSYITQKTVQPLSPKLSPSVPTETTGNICITTTLCACEMSAYPEDYLQALYHQVK
uniref:Uncharacterized protein n=1 Tax=viral metagenome TaxID=1070528 RepID=A0A6C0F9Z5_9ZZZZ